MLAAYAAGSLNIGVAILISEFKQALQGLFEVLFEWLSSIGFGLSLLLMGVVPEQEAGLFEGDKLDKSVDIELVKHRRDDSLHFTGGRRRRLSLLHMFSIEEMP